MADFCWQLATKGVSKIAKIDSLKSAYEVCAALDSSNVQANLATDEEGLIVEQIFQLCKNDLSGDVFYEMISNWLDNDNPGGVVMIGLIVVYQAIIREKEMIEEENTKACLCVSLRDLIQSPHDRVRQITVTVCSFLFSLGLLLCEESISFIARRQVSNETDPLVKDEMQRLLCLISSD
jgi:hypothetical protein